MNALRKAETYYRVQGRLGVVMKKDDETKAMEIILRTVKKLNDYETALRILDYVSRRIQSEFYKNMGQPQRAMPVETTAKD